MLRARRFSFVTMLSLVFNHAVAANPEIGSNPVGRLPDAAESPNDSVGVSHHEF